MQAAWQAQQWHKLVACDVFELYCIIPRGVPNILSVLADINIHINRPKMCIHMVYLIKNRIIQKHIFSINCGHFVLLDNIILFSYLLCTKFLYNQFRFHCLKWSGSWWYNKHVKSKSTVLYSWHWEKQCGHRDSCTISSCTRHHHRGCCFQPTPTILKNDAQSPHSDVKGIISLSDVSGMQSPVISPKRGEITGLRSSTAIGSMIDRWTYSNFVTATCQMVKTASWKISFKKKKSEKHTAEYGMIMFPYWWNLCCENVDYA